MFVKEKKHIDSAGWIHCPQCGSKTRTKIRTETVLKHFPVFCPKCGVESLIDVEYMKLIIREEPDAKTQSR